MTKRHTLTRRATLRGMGGACLALPFLEMMGGCDVPRGARKALRAGPTRRFVVFWTPNGTRMEDWRPSGSEDAFTMSPMLAALEPHKQDIIMLDGLDALSAYTGPGDAHQKGTGQCLTGTPLQEGGFPGDGGLSAGWADGISVDQAIADAVGQATKFRSLEFGVYVHGANVGSRISYRGPAQPIPPENDPKAAFDRIFKDLVSDPEQAADLIAERHLVLDAVAEEYKKLLPRVGAADRLKLEAHLAAVRDIEMRLDSEGTVGGICVKPELGDVDDPLLVKNIPATGKLQMDLLAMALGCGLTNVASIMWTNSASNKPFPWLDIPEGHHELAHRGDGDTDAQNKIVKINAWYAEQFAYLVAKLKSMPEGEGTVLDNTILVWANEHSRGNNHDRNDMPYVIAGRGGGSVLPGRWLTADGDVPHNNLWVGVMNAMGIDTNTFGNPDYCTGAFDLS